MQKVTILCTGKLKEKFYLDAVAEYVKRLNRFCKLEIIELPEERLPEDPSPAQIEAALSKEADAVRAKLPNGCLVIAMCVEGRERSSEELARYVFIWQIWLGTSVSMKGNDHIRMDMLSNKLKGRGKLVLAIVANVILLLFCVFLVKYGFDLVMSMKARGNSSTALKIPMWIVYASLPFSQLVVGLRIIGQIVTSVKELGGGSGESETKEAEA